MILVVPVVGALIAGAATLGSAALGLLGQKEQAREQRRFLELQAQKQKELMQQQAEMQVMLLNKQKELERERRRTLLLNRLGRQDTPRNMLVVGFVLLGGLWLFLRLRRSF